MKKITKIGVATVLLCVVLISCKEEKKTAPEVIITKEAPPYEGDLAIGELHLPEGFKIDVFAEGVDGARSMAMGDNGTLFVGTRNENKVYALQDLDGDFRAEKIIELDTTLKVPNGLAFKDGALYVAEVGRLLRYPNIEKQLDNPPTPEVIYDDYPTEFHHGWKYIAFGPDGKLYVPVGAPCNICEKSDEDERFATITRMDPDGTNREIYAKGVRNSVGFTWHPDSEELWFTDNGRDMMGDDIPPCELNRVTEAGQHFGYPYCHGGTIVDPEFGDQYPCSDFEAPVKALGPHVAPLGIKFYTGTMFPERYRGMAFIAEHGSWNRTSKVGYKISTVTLEDDKAIAYDTFLNGWLNEETQEAFGRPVDILQLEDGSLLISDDLGDAIYRLSYKEAKVASLD